MTQHTPGPWEVWNHDNDPRHVYVGPVKGGLCVAAVVSCNAHGVYTPDTEARGRADAQLVSAAPDLLAALKQIVSTPAYIYEYHDGERLSAIMDIANEAIRKAEGY